MNATLTEQDKDYIWQVVHHSVIAAGGYHNLFCDPLAFDEDSQGIHFHWPTWMRAIRVYLITQYGAESLNRLIMPVLAEVYRFENYEKYLKRLAQQTPIPTPAAKPLWKD